MEEHFKNKLKNHKVEWDKEELLSSMKQELASDKPKYNWKLLLLIPLVFVSTCWGLKKSGISFSNTAALQGIQENSSANSKLESSEAQEVYSNEISSKPQQMLERNASNTKLGLHEASNHVNISSFDKFSNQAPVDISGSKSTINAQVRRSVSDTISTEKKTIIKRWSSQRSPSTVSVINQGLENVNTTMTEIAEVLKTNRSSGLHEQQQESKLPDVLPHLGISHFAIESTIPYLETEPMMIQPESNSPTDTTPSKNSFFISGIGEVGLVNRSTNFLSDDEVFTTRLELNDKTVSSRAALSTNVLIGYKHQAGWSIQSGFQYNQVIEFLKYDGVGRDSTYFTTTESSFLRIDTEERKVRHWNKHNYYTIPIDLSYHKKLNKVSFYGLVGVSYTLAHNFTGKVNELTIDGTNEIAENPLYTLSSRLGMQAGVGLSYPLFKQTELFAQLSYRRNSSLGSEWKKQFHQSYSVGAGFRVFLKRDN